MLTNLLTIATTTSTADESVFASVMSSVIGGLYSYMQAFSATLISTVDSTIQSTFPPATIMRIIYAFIFAHVIWQLMETLVRSTHEQGRFDFGHWLAGFYTAFSKIFPRFLTTVLLAMAVAAGSGVIIKSSTKGGNASAFYSITENESTQTPFSKLLSAYSPSNSLAEASSSMATAVNRLDYIRIRSQVMRSVRDMADKAQFVPSSTTEAMATGTASILARIGDDILWMWLAIGEWIFSFFNDLVFAYAQFYVAKALILNYVYFTVAWNTSVVLLPVFVLMSYWPSLRGLLTSVLTHLITLAIAGAIVAGMAQFLTSTAVWTDIIKTAFESIQASPTEYKTLAANSMPHLFATYGVWVANIQLSFILMIIGTVIERTYQITSATINGSVSAAFEGNLKAGIGSMFGRTYKS